MERKARIARTTANMEARAMTTTIAHTDSTNTTTVINVLTSNNKTNTEINSIKDNISTNSTQVAASRINKTPTTVAIIRVVVPGPTTNKTAVQTSNQEVDPSSELTEIRPVVTSMDNNNRVHHTKALNFTIRATSRAVPPITVRKVDRNPIIKIDHHATTTTTNINSNNNNRHNNNRAASMLNKVNQLLRDNNKITWLTCLMICRCINVCRRPFKLYQHKLPACHKEVPVR